MAELQIIDWNTIREKFVGKTIAQLDEVDVATAAVTAEPKLSVKGVDFSLGASAKLAINAYHSAGDTDDEKVVGAAGAIPFTPGNAWLRYSLTGDLSAGARAKLGSAGIDIAGESQIVFSDYRVHQPSDPADVTALADLAAPRTLLRLDDVLALGNNEALYYELRGSLTFLVTVSWADIYTKTLSEIASVLPSADSFAFEIDAGANASFTVTLTDDFVLVFWRDAAGGLHTGVRKSSSRGGTLKAGFSVTAKFSDPSAVAQAAADFLKGYAGDDLAGVQNKVEDQIRKAAETEIGASWKYEYSRVESTKFVLEAPLTGEQLRTYHPSLVAQNAAPLLADSSIALTNYLNETTVVRKRSIGFSLGIGKWFSIGDHDQKTLTTRTRRTRDGRREMISYVGARTFGGDRNWSIGEYAFDFRAEMDDYAETPRTADFQFGLTFTMSTPSQKLTDDAIASIVDTASLWSIIAEKDADAIAGKLAVAKGKDATARFELKFSEPVLRYVTPIAGVRDDSRMALAIAAAMPWSAFPARSSWRSRSALYAPAWLQILREQSEFDIAFRQVKNAVKAKDPASADLDETKDHMWTLRSLIEGHPKLVAHYSMWAVGANLLAQAVGAGTLSHTKVETIFNDLYDFFSQVLYVRAIGRHLVDIASRSGHLGDVGRAASVSYGDKVIVMSS